VGAILDVLERRATKVTGGNPQTLQYWVKKLFGARESTSGIAIDEDTALRYSAVWDAVNIIAGAIGMLPMMVYRRDKNAKTKTAEHPVYKLVHDRPNPYMDALTFMETLQGHVLTWGNGYAEIERVGSGRPIALWPVTPNRTAPTLSQDGKDFYYRITKVDGSQTTVAYRNMLHIKGLGFNGLQGYPVIEYAADSLGLGMAAEKYAAKFYANDASPGGVLRHPENLSPDAKTRLADAWNAEHKGLDNVSRVAILEEGMEWQAIGIPPESARLVETLKFTIADVARWYHIPLHMLSELERATFSNIEHQGIDFVVWTLTRWLRRWEMECNYKLFSDREYGTYFTEFLVDALLRGDTKSRYEAYRVAILGGWFGRHEAREKENLNPVDGLDTFLEPINYKPVGTPWPEKIVPRNLLRLNELLQTSWQRILTKEINTLRTALKKPAQFLSRADTF